MCWSVEEVGRDVGKGVGGSACGVTSSISPQVQLGFGLVRIRFGLVRG